MTVREAYRRAYRRLHTDIFGPPDAPLCPEVDRIIKSNDAKWEFENSHLRPMLDSEIPDEVDTEQLITAIMEKMK